MIRVLFVASLLALSTAGFSAGTVAGATAPPQAGRSLQLVAIQGYQLTVVGSHWQPEARVVFSFQQPALAQGLQLIPVVILPVRR